MKFDTPSAENPTDRLRVVGQPVDRIDGPLKTTGRAPYAYEHHDGFTGGFADGLARPAYGHVLGAGIARGRIRSFDAEAARRAPGVLAVISADNAGPLGQGPRNTAKLLGGPRIEHYHQAIALVVAESFEQARAAARLIRVEYAREAGEFDLAKVRDSGRARAAEVPTAARVLWTLLNQPGRVPYGELSSLYADEDLQGAFESLRRIEGVVFLELGITLSVDLRTELGSLEWPT